MRKQFDNKITWVIKNFSSSQPTRLKSDHFVVSGCKWFLVVNNKEIDVDSFSLYLHVANYESLPFGWRRNARFLLTIVNQLSGKSFIIREILEWFDKKSNSWGFPSMFPLNELHAEDSGFLVNGELKIKVEIEVLKVIGKLDVTEDTSIIIESLDVNGFQLLPSQAKPVRRMFERHPEIASEFCPKKPKLRTGYMSLLLSLIETICESSQELSKEDVSDLYAALGSLKAAGFELDWLEKKLNEVSEKKENEQTQLQEMEEELKVLKQKYSDMEALVEKQKAKVSAPKAPLSLDDLL